jgi:hypothetical protein
MASRASDSRSWRHVRDAAFEENLRFDWRDEDVDSAALGRSQYGRLIKAVTDAAADHAASTAADPEDSNYSELAQDGCSVVRELRSGLGCFEKEGDARLLVWRHQDSAAQLIAKDQSPPMARYEIESAAQAYLDLPYRVPEIDRLLVDVLVALELFAYGDEATGNKMMSGGGPSPLKLKPVRGFIFGHGLNLVLALILGAAFWGVSLTGLFPESWLPAVWGILLVLWLGLLAIGVISFPRFWLAATKARKQALALLTAMNGVYAELSSSGPISTRHIERRTRAASNEGVIWPAPLFVLLDDINGRGGRM